MQTHSIIAIVALLLAALAASLAAQGADLLPTIQARGQLRCGVDLVAPLCGVTHLCGAPRRLPGDPRGAERQGDS